MKYIFILLAVCFMARISFATTHILAHCSGYKLPNGLALSFEYVTDPKNTGDSPSEIHSYEQETLRNNAPVIYLGPELCTAERKQGSNTVCTTELSEFYTMDPATHSATEAGDGYKARYTCEFQL